MTVEDCETTTITSSIVEKTLEVSTFSSKVWVLHVAPPSHPSPYNVDSKTFRHDVASEFCHEHDFLQHLAQCMRNKNNIDVTALFVRGSTINTVLEESERLVIDLVVLGCQKHGQLFSALMDDTDESLLAKCSRPIMFVPT